MFAATYLQLTKVVLMFFILLQLAPASRDLSQAEKRISITVERIHSNSLRIRMVVIFP